MKKHFYSNSEGFLTHRPPEKIQKIINFNNNILYRNNINKNEMTDKEGLNKAYNESKKIYVNPNNKTMYIAGTSSFQDVYDDLKIPLKLTKYSQRYQDVEKVLRNNNNSIDILVGHSLGSSVGLELNKNKYYTDCIYDPLDATSANGSIAQNNTSLTWRILDPRVKCNLLTLDSGLKSEYDKFLLSEKSLPVRFETYITQSQTVNGLSDIKLNVARALSRLNAVFITFFKATNNKDINKSAVEFSHPMAAISYDSTKELEWQLSLGGKTFPIQSCRSITETYYRLIDCLNLPDIHQHSTSIVDFNSYKTNQFIIGYSFEKVREAHWSGESTKAGELLQVSVKTVDNTAPFDTIFTTLKAEVIMYISDKGVELFP